MTSALQSIISRPKTVLTLMVVMVAAGVMSYLGIPKEANPDIDVPVYYVSISQQGISPEDAERLLVRPMETQLRGLDGLKELTAIASEGHAGIVLEFNIDYEQGRGARRHARQGRPGQGGPAGRRRRTPSSPRPISRCSRRSS